MADDFTEGSGGAEQPAAAPETTTQVKTGTDAAGSESASPADAAGSNPWGDKWRENIITGVPADQREKAQNYLKTRSSPYDILRSGMAADQKISELQANRGVKIPTGKNDDPKEVEAYRKARGVPESFEKYDLPVPQEVGSLSDFEKELQTDFLKQAHAQHWNQKDIDLARNTWFTAQRMLKAEEYKQVAAQSQANVDALRVEMGSDYRPNIELVNRMFSQEMARVGVESPDERRAALSIRLADGSLLGEKPWFVKMMTNIARERADAGAFVDGETVDGGDVDGRINKIMGLMHTNPKEYERMQPELDKLIAVQNRRKGK